MPGTRTIRTCGGCGAEVAVTVCFGEPPSPILGTPATEDAIEPENCQTCGCEFDAETIV